MNIKQKNINLVIIAVLIIITAFTAFHEGYFSIISIPFLLSILAGFALAIWLSRHITTWRLLALILGIFIIEYIKETIGIRSWMWIYHGIDGQYNFGVWAWVLGGLAAFTLSTRIAIKLLRRLKLPALRWLNPIILILIFLLLLAALGEYREGAEWSFYLLYILLLAGTLYASYKMDFAVFAGIVITAWIVGNLSEYMGSIASGVWTFPFNPNYPPVFLLFGCWPIEILAQYSLSAYMSGEPLNEQSFID